MKQPNRFIFRSTAVKHYLQSRERDVFPRLLSPFVFGFYWLLLGLLLLAIGITWWGEVPVYASGAGLLLTMTKHATQSEQDDMQALIFVPIMPGQPAFHVDTNTPILLENSAANLQINGEITSIDPDIVSPQVARKRYKLTSSNTADLILLPSLVLHARITTYLPADLYAGSVVHASIQSGSQRLLSLLPGVPSLLGDAQ